MQSTHYLRTVSQVIVKKMSFDKNLQLSRLCYLAVEDQYLDLRNLHLVLVESSQQTANVFSYIEATSQRHEFQIVRGYVSEYRVKLFSEISSQLNIF